MVGPDDLVADADWPTLGRKAIGESQMSPVKSEVSARWMRELDVQIFELVQLTPLTKDEQIELLDGVRARIAALTVRTAYPRPR